MQTYSQTFLAAQTWELNIPGKYFITLAIPTACNYKFFKAGKRLDLGEIKGLGVGLEVGPLAGLHDEYAFDRVEIEILAPGTYTVGVGDGAVRYNNSVASVTISTNRVPQTAAAQSTATVTSVSAQLVAANANRQSLQIQNKDAAGSIYLRVGAAGATVANGIEVGPKGSYEFPAGTVDTGVIHAIGNIASNANIVILEG